MYLFRCAKKVYLLFCEFGWFLEWIFQNFDELFATLNRIREAETERIQTIPGPKYWFKDNWSDACIHDTGEEISKEVLAVDKVDGYTPTTQSRRYWEEFQGQP